MKKITKLLTLIVTLTPALVYSEQEKNNKPKQSQIENESQHTNVELVKTPLVKTPLEDNTGHSYASLIFENDVFFNEDGGYTNGVGIAWGRGLFKNFEKENTPWPLYHLVNKLPINTQRDRHRAISYLFGQMMSTPEDITKPAPTEGDSPYVGLLAGRVTFHSFNAVRTDRLTLTLGLVGPSSGAEETQKFVHKITGSENPEGWDTQIRDEPVFRIERSRSDRYWDHAFDNGLQVDFIGTTSAGLGNLYSDVGYGVGFRVGQNLRDSFPTATGLPGREINPTAGNQNRHWEFYLNLWASYTFNDLMIEGNTYKDSYGAQLTHEQLKLSYGTSYNVGRWAFSYTGAISSEQYEEQADLGRFGSINVTYKLQ